VNDPDATAEIATAFTERLGADRVVPPTPRPASEYIGAFGAAARIPPCSGSSAHSDRRPPRRCRTPRSRTRDRIGVVTRSHRLCTPAKDDELVVNSNETEGRPCARRGTLRPRVRCVRKLALRVHPSSPGSSWMRVVKVRVRPRTPCGFKSPGDTPSRCPRDHELTRGRCGTADLRDGLAPVRAPKRVSSLWERPRLWRPASTASRAPAGGIAWMLSHRPRSRAFTRSEAVQRD
jgi:hypothetical protein